MEDTLKYINEIYDSCKVIYPPDTEKQRHSDTLMQMKRVINAIEVYQELMGTEKNSERRLIFSFPSLRV